ncbi:DUF5994 family protein [Mycobacterium sp. MS1601]|uniref:DUF5994 family protein n=1 Tax=Mycobacterium sp. MS1601 TaxID=1936029 RepID=UPI0009FA327D|nr:DUF5994 family protein [Mycobacterium sp. MS1601]
MTPQQPLDDVEHHSTPRLRLKPKGPQTGYVDGAWWPESTELTTELPDLVTVLSVRLGPVDCVLYHLGSWADVPRKITLGTQRLRLGGYRRQPMNTIELVGPHGRIILLVVPPETDAADAHAIMMAAAARDNSAAPADLLGLRASEEVRA